MAGRQIVLDTETTGLSAHGGDRVIEIGCIELLSRRITDRRFHTYIDPGRDIEEGAQKVHGLTREFLSDKPKFGDVARDFLDYVRGAELIIHNAPFDVEFLDLELGLLGLGRLDGHVAGIIDTLVLARELHPGRRNSLDALCERYGIDNAHRTLHGAVLDAELLAEVYLAMTRGQDTLLDELDLGTDDAGECVNAADVERLVVLHPSEAELAAHERAMDGIDKVSGGSLWRRLGGGG